MKKPTTFNLVKKLFYSLDLNRKVQFFLLIILNVFSSCIEAIAISASYPFLSLLQSPESINAPNNLLNFIFNSFGLNYEFRSIVLFFISTILFSSFLKFLVLALNTIYASVISYDFSLASFNTSLFQEYNFYLKNPIAKLVNRNIKGIEGTYTVLYALLQVLTSSLLILITLAFLVFLNPKLTSGIFFLITLIYTLIFGTFKNFMTKASHIIYNNNSFKIKVVQEAYRSFKSIVLDKTGHVFIKSYKKNEFQLRKIQALYQIIIQCPKIIIENSILILLALTALILIPSDNVNFTFLALLGTYALGFQRLLPIAQSMFLALSDIKKQKADLEDVLKLSIKRNVNHKEITKTYDQIEVNEINIKNVNYFHDRSNKDLIKDINIKLKPGDYLGISGKSGTGKTTLLDIVLGLIKPSSGNILINGIDINVSNSKLYLEKWQNSISYVPQSPLILNDSIKKNLLLNGSKNQDNSDKELYEILETVQLKDFVNSLPYKIETILGDDGNAISGGQKQRIAIARALLKRGKILVLDESTSALDRETEKLLLENIVNKFPELIIIFVSHNPNVFEYANVLLSLDK